MELWQSLWTLILVILFSCKTNLHGRVSHAKEMPDQNSSIDSADLVGMTEKTSVEQPRDAVGLCAAIKNDEAFPAELVTSQLNWLCQNGGLEIARQNLWKGTGSVNVREYFPERDKTVHYVASALIKGEARTAVVFGSALCENPTTFTAYAKKHRFTGFQSIDSVSPAEDACEYMFKPEHHFGVNMDMKLVSMYGQIADSEIYWRVERLTSPLNYSSVRYHTGLFLSWKEPDGVRGVYLLKARSGVGGVYMNGMRSKWKAAVSETLEMAAALLKDKQL